VVVQSLPPEKKGEVDGQNLREVEGQNLREVEGQNLREVEGQSLKKGEVGEYHHLVVLGEEVGHYGYPRRKFLP